MSKTILPAIILAILFFSCGSNTNNVSTSAYSDSAVGAPQPIPVQQQSTEELKEELKKRESEEPSTYLSVDDATMRENLIGEKVFEGHIVNSSTTASFKDVVLEITAYTKTETELGSVSKTIYEYIGPGQSVNYKIKLTLPKETEQFNIVVKDAVAVE